MCFSDSGQSSGPVKTSNQKGDEQSALDRILQKNARYLLQSKLPMRSPVFIGHLFLVM
jgi:hypothetical protein